jgi:purine nucleosidase
MEILMSDLYRPPAGPRVRVISDNDYAGDPDGLFQLAHHALSPSVELRAVISSHLAPGDPFDDTGRSAANGAAAASRVLDLLGVTAPVHAGVEQGLMASGEPQPSPAARVIIDEALRTDTERPLFVTLGAGLTELATAYLLEPAIAGKLTAVWIGGPEHPQLGASPPPGATAVEYNLAIDRRAAQVVFGSEIPLWQVPRNTYREALVSMTELAVRVRPKGPIGKHLYESLDAVHIMAADTGHNLGETYVLGDNPLVLLTALQSSFEMDPSSSTYHTIARPSIDDNGQYHANPTGAPIRVYSALDLRLMFEDLYAKLAIAATDEASGAPA